MTFGFRPLSATNLLQSITVLAAFTSIVGAQQRPTTSTTVRGAVYDSAASTPIARARIQIGGRNRSSVLTDSAGRFELANVPVGKDSISVRAQGYLPYSAFVEFTSDAGSFLVMLQKMEVTLDTIAVTARPDDPTGFEERRRGGIGRFLTARELDRRVVNYASELFKSIPGVFVASDIKIRGPFGNCSPVLWIDGSLYTPSPNGITPAEIDIHLKPGQIAGIEIYYTNVPLQFQHGLSGCGSIVIWKKH